MCKKYSSATIVLLAAFLVFCTACDNTRDPIGKAVALDGSEYTLLDREVVFLDGDKMLVITYVSENVADLKKLEKEFSDLYEVISFSVDANVDYDFLGLEAVSSNKKNGRISGYRDRKPISEILELKSSVEKAVKDRNAK